MDFSNHDELGQIEAALRSERPRLGGDVESAICGRVGSGRSGGGRRASMAVILSVGTLVAMSAFGGVGYANFGFQLNPFRTAATTRRSRMSTERAEGKHAANTGQDLLYWLLHHHH